MVSSQVRRRRAALRCTQHQATTEDEALADIAEIVGAVAAARRQGILDYAAAMFAESGPKTPHYPAAFDLLVRAGADREGAQALRAARGAAPFTVAG